MRTKYLFLSCLFSTFVLFLPGALAQNYSQWSLPEGATARIGKGVITDIAYSPNGAQLAVASRIGVWIYDAHTSKELDLLTKHSLIYSIAYSPDGKTLATADNLNVYLWDAETRKYKTTLIKSTKDMFFIINSIAYSPDGTTLATTGGTEAYLWDAETGKHKATLIEHAHEVNSLMYSLDGKTIATTIGDHTVYLWDADTGKRKAILRGHTDSINSLAFSPDGTTLATASRDKTGHLWGINTGKSKKILEELPGERFSVAYSPDGRTIATAIGSYVGLWDIDTDTHKKTLKGHLLGYWGYIYSVVYSPDGKTIATASKSEVRFWDAETGKNTGTLKGHMYPGDFVTYSPDGKTIATAIGSPSHRQHDDIIFLWNAITGVRERDCKNAKKGGLGYVESLTYSPDGKTIAAAIGNEVHFWNASTGKQHETTLKGHTRFWISAAAYSPDGKTISIAVEDKVSLWNVKTGKYKNTLRHTAAVSDIAYSPDGTTLASASGNEAYFWDTETGKHINTLKGHATTITSVTYSPDSSTLVTTNSTDEVRLWDVNIGVWDVSGHISTLKGYISFVYSPDGKTITTVNGTKVKLWDARMEKNITILTSGSSGQPVYSPDGKTLATSSANGTTLLWDTRILASQFSQQPPTSISDEQDLFDDLFDEIPQQPSMPITEVATPQTPQQIAKRALASTVLIVMEDADGQLLSTGSGFFVERGIIATNLHVVEGVLNGYVKWVGVDKTYRIQGIVAMDSRQDLALIKVSDVGASVLSIGKSNEVQIGEPVYVAGNPIGFLEGTFSNGIVSGVREFRVGSERIQITAPISEGSSGGPVLNNKGEVIGVAVSTITVGQNLNFAIPSNYLSELLRKIRGRK